MIIIRPDYIENRSENKLNTKSVFLAGTIDNGNSEDWQSKVIDELSNSYLSLEVYNPRRKTWNANPSKNEIEAQIKWEQDHLDKADLIALVLWDNSKSHISLLEMGLYASSKKLIIFCTNKFYRFDNVNLTCKKYGIPLIQSTNIKKISDKIIAYI